MGGIIMRIGCHENNHTFIELNCEQILGAKE